MSISAYIGLGSNLDNPPQQVRLAIDAVAGIPACRLEQRSSLYGNPPMGPQDQPDYVNAVVEITTALAPHDLLNELNGIEQAQGRQRGGRHWGPRTIDLDLLVYGEWVLADERLVVPHPGVAERAFVLLPLYEIAPNLAIPELGRVHSLLDRVDTSALVQLDETLPITS